MAQNNSSNYKPTRFRLQIGGANNAFSDFPAGTSGQICLSQGSSADPIWSTATYPLSAGTSGNVVTSDGTNWVSQAPPTSNVLYLQGSLTNAQIKALGTTPVTILAAPGAGKVIQAFTAMSVMVYGGNNAFTSGFPIYIGYASNSNLLVAISTTNQITATASKSWCAGWVGGSVNLARSVVSNAALVIGCPGTIAGNASNDNTFSYQIAYQIFTY